MGCDQLTAAETFHLFGTSDSEKLKHHSELEHGPHGYKNGGLFSTYTLRTPMQLVVIHENNLTGDKEEELAEYRLNNDPEPEWVICSACNGSGQGYSSPDSTCRSCKGGGELRVK
jgi:hypothetical protein